MYPIETLNHLLGFATIALQFVTLALIVLLIARKKYPALADASKPVERWGLWVALATVVGAVSMALYYSEILGIIPCGLCWLMRIFMFSQVPLFALAAWRSDKNIADYSIVLSIAGIFLGFYQHYLQMGGASVLPCPASGGGDCGLRFMFEFGYITFPLMGASLFAFLIVLMLFVRNNRA